MIGYNHVRNTGVFLVTAILLSLLAGCGGGGGGTGNGDSGITNAGFTITGQVSPPGGGSPANVLVVATKVEDGITASQARALAVKSAVAGSTINTLSTTPEGSGTYATVTDAEGVYILQVYEEGSYFVEASKGGFKATSRATVTPKASTVADFTLIPTGSLAGTVTLQGTNDHSGTFVIVLGTGYLGYTATDGTFTIEDISVESYQVRFVHAGFATHDVAGDVTIPIADTLILEPVLLQAGATGGSISGTVTDSQDDGPIAGVLVRVQDTAYFAYTDPNGVYRLEDITPGTYTLSFNHDLIDEAAEKTGVQVTEAAATIADQTMTDAKPPVWESTAGAVTAFSIETPEGDRIAVEFGTALDASQPLTCTTYYNTIEEWDSDDWTNNDSANFSEGDLYAGIRAERGCLLEGLEEGRRYVVGVRVKDRHGNTEYNASEILCVPGDETVTAAERENLLAAVGRIGIGTSAPEGLLHVQPEDGGLPFVIDGETGNVGIGTTDPQAPLTVGDGKFTVNENGLVTAGVWQGYAITDDYIASVSAGKVTGNIPGNAANVTGTVAIDHGGTGAADAVTARSNLGLGAVSTLSAVSGGDAGTITDNTITNADISVQAAIVGSKIAPDFGDNDIITTGNVGIGTAEPVYKLDVAGSIRLSEGTLVFPDGTSMTSAGTGSASSLSNAADLLVTADSDSTDGGEIFFKIGDSQKMVITNDGGVGIGTTDPGSYLLNINGTAYLADNITMIDGGTVDGRDLSVDGTKLDEIEAGATITNAANVTAAGAVMDGDFSIDGLMKRTAEGTYTTITDNAANWDNAYTDRLSWDGGSTGLTAATGRTSLGLGSLALQDDDNVAITGGTLTGIGSLALTGNTTVSDTKTVDGRDLSVDGIKLDTIEDNADVTDAANVANAGAVMDGDFSGNGILKRTGEGTYATVTDNAANWNTAYTAVNANATNWDSTYTSVTANSSNWDNAYTSVNTNSSNWDSAYTAVNANSTNWNTAYSERRQWDGNATSLSASTGRTSLGLGSMAVQNAGSVAITGGALAGISTLALTGNITLSAGNTVDGRDLSIDGTRLDTIETGADITDAANVTAAGAVMDGDFSTNGLMKRTAAGTYATITDSTGNWDTAYTERRQWDGSATSLSASTGRSSLGLGTLAMQNAGSVAITGGSVSGIIDLAVADGGTGASDAAGSRTNLGLVSGAAGDIWVEKAGDTMTGTLVLPANGLTAGTSQLTLASGKVGVGTSAPASPLHLNAADNGTSITLFTLDRVTASPADNDAYHISFSHTNDAAAQEVFARISLLAGDVSDGTEAGSLAFAVADGTDGSIDEALRIEAGGNVGVGTSDPAARLEVAGVIHSTAGGIKFPDGTVQATAAAGGGSGDSHSLDADDGSPTDVVYVDADGQVGIGTTEPAYLLDVDGSIHLKSGALVFPDGSSMTVADSGSASSLSNAADLPLIADSDSAGGGEIQFSIAGGQKMVVANDGDVGIGTADPGSYRLYVNGTAYLADSLSLAADKTVDGRNLTIDGAKLDGIEENADVTDAANVTAAGAMMDNDFSANGLMKRTAAGAYTVVTDSSANWGTAYTERRQWNGSATNLAAATGRTSLGLGTIAVQSAGNVDITGGTITGITDLAVADGGTGASDANAARASLGLAIGTDIQAFDDTLKSLAELSTGANLILYTTGTDIFATSSITAAGRALLDDADTAAQRATLGLDSGGAGAIWLEKAGGAMTGALQVAGVVDSTSGGFRFPDDTLQTTAAAGDGSSLDASDGSPANVLRVDTGGIVHVGDGSIPGRTKLYAGYGGPLLSLSEYSNPRYAVGLGTTHVVGYGQRLDFFTGDSGGNELDLTTDHIRMSIRHDGAVGIGTTVPAEKLHVTGAARLQGGVFGYEGTFSAADSAKLGLAGVEFTDRRLAVDAYLAAETGYGFGEVAGNSTICPYVRLFHNSYNGNDGFFVLNETNDPLMIVRAMDGYVGIGTPAPAGMLDVRGHAFLGGSDPNRMLKISSGWTGYPDEGDGAEISVDGNTYYALMIAGSDQDQGKNRWIRMYDTVSIHGPALIDGDVGIGTDSPAANLEIWNNFSSGTDSLRFGYSDGSPYWMGIQPYVVESGNVGYKFRTTNQTSTVDALAITGEGKVGIGTTTPAATLDVQGDVHIGGDTALEDDGVFYFGDTATDGTWRVVRDGDDLSFQRRESGTWVSKLKINP